MNFHLIDALIIGAYPTATIAIGFRISKRAARSIRNYLLGGNQIPWPWPVFDQIILRNVERR